jgi:hypothetical protein
MRILASLFDAFLKCPTKCWLRARNETPSGNSYAEWVQSQNESYRAAQIERLLAQTPLSESARSPFAENLKTAKWRLAVDLEVQTPEPPGSSRREEAPSQNAEGGVQNAESSQSLVTSAATTQTVASPPAFIAESHLHAVERVPAEGRGHATQFLPIRFIFFNKLTQDDKLLLAFDAFVLAQGLGRDAPLGKIIHGDLRDCVRSSRGNEAPSANAEGEVRNGEPSQSLLTSAATSRIGSDDEVEEPATGTSASLSAGQPQPRVTKVKTSALAGEVRKRLEKIAALLSSPTPPDLVLNRHCAECEFQDRCRKIAIEKDDLSLLAGMSAKERQKLRSKGIFTVTQLSYTFRPRRRPKRLRDKREKYHHSLKALAIREKKIHVVGSPELKIEGTPVYLDVEGLPDRDFYYLIGLRIGHGDAAVQHSLWADTVADEGKIWREFLAILETVEKPVLIHYGSYENTFLNRMSERHGKPAENVRIVEAIEKPLNVLSVMFAQFYFPTYSNGLKDTARGLGFRWSDPTASGARSVVVRSAWEQSRELTAREWLVRYNAEDCDALDIVAASLLRTVRSGGQPTVDESTVSATVHVDSLKPEMPFIFGKKPSVTPEVEFLRKAAHWHYQRDRIYLRTGNELKRATKARTPALTPAMRVNEEILCQRPRFCPRCKRKGIKPVYSATRILRDLRFSRFGLRRWTVKYHFQSCYCPVCGVCFGKPSEFWQGTYYGPNVAALLIYKTVDLCMQQRTIAQELNRLYQLGLHERQVHRLKAKAAGLYEDSRRMILEEMLKGAVIQVDETRIDLRLKSAYVWVFATFREVVYFYAESREGGLPQRLLQGFKGVLVSDFYAVYDALPCSQQKCLIHLMRDLNDAVLDNPYDDGVKGVVASFATLLKGIVETTDRRGLKRFFLRKHLLDVDRFYRQLSRADYRSEAALKCKERFEKNRERLFTFLDHDGVPWNNNNAEHAIKAFARLRRTIDGLSTPKGIEDYLVLLSVCQTCKYMGVDFLDFLRSGEKDIHAFAESRRGRKRLSPTHEPQAPPADVSAEQ